MLFRASGTWVYRRTIGFRLFGTDRRRPAHGYYASAARPACAGNKAYVISGNRVPCRLLCLYYCIVARLASINVLRIERWCEGGTLSPILVLLSHVPTVFLSIYCHGVCVRTSRCRYAQRKLIFVCRWTHLHSLTNRVRWYCAPRTSRTDSSGLVVKFKVSAYDLSIANLFCSRISRPSSIGNNPPPRTVLVVRRLLTDRSLTEELSKRFTTVVGWNEDVFDVCPLFIVLHCYRLCSIQNVKCTWPLFIISCQISCTVIFCNDPLSKGK